MCALMRIGDLCLYFIMDRIIIIVVIMIVMM